MIMPPFLLAYRTFIIVLSKGLRLGCWVAADLGKSTKTIGENGGIVKLCLGA